MAGRDKTNAWNSIKFIKEHLPLWKEKGMTKGFLNSMIEPKYRACSIDVESALSCEIIMFETAYNQPDFITKLKEICKRYRMPYGKVKPEVEQQVSEELELLFNTFKDEKPLRIEKGDKHKGIEKNTLPVIFKVKNINELSKMLETKRDTVCSSEGYKTMSTDPERLELILNVIRQDIKPKQQEEILDLSYESILKYCRFYKWAGILNKSSSKEKYLINYDLVKFEDGYFEKEDEYVNELFDF